MTTSERELTQPVDLCTDDGAALNPAARGWSRRPLHRANLHGRIGTNKRWDYWAVLAGDLVVSSVYSDIDHLGLADVWWVDLASAETGGRGIVTRPGAGIELPEIPATAPLTVNHDGFELQITDEATGTRLVAAWTERDGRGGRLDVLVSLPPGHESVNVAPGVRHMVGAARRRRRRHARLRGPTGIRRGSAPTLVSARYGFGSSNTSGISRSVFVW